MLLKNWLAPVQQMLVDQARNAGEGHFGSSVALHDENSFPDLPKGSIALIGFDDKAADLVRSELYLLSFPFGKCRIADLGNLRRENDSFVIPLLKELLQGKVLPILIGKEAERLRALFMAELQLLRSLKLALIDERMALLEKDPRTGKKGYLEDIGQLPPEKLFHLSLLGIQGHFLSPQQFDWLKKQGFDIMRLGAMREDITRAEPLLRDADLLAFHLSALKMSEAPGVKCATPNGLYAEEACQLARYAGMSDKLTAFSLFGLNPPLDRANQTAQLAAQIIWYFIEGINRRVKDYPYSTSQMTEYIVPLPQKNLQLSFWKSEKSGRWWLQMPLHTQQAEERHRLIPCSYQDYVEAGSGELPDTIWKWLDKNK